MRHPLIELRELIIGGQPTAGVVLSVPGNGICFVATQNGAIPYRYIGNQPAVGDKVLITGGMVSIARKPSEVYQV